MKDQIEVPNSPPSHWTNAALGEVATVVNGGTPKSKVAEYWDGDVEWLTPKDMGQMDGREISVTPRTISAAGLAKSSARLVPPQSVILSTRAPIGHLAINSVPMAFNQGCRGIVPGKRLDHVFLYYFLAASRQKLNDLGSGTTFKELSATNLRAVELPLPPLEEQERIVAVLDQAFAALDRARAHAEANLADAQELGTRAVEDELASEELGTLKPLGDYIDLLTGFAFKSRGYTEDLSDIRLIRGDNIVQGAFRWDGLKRWPISDRDTYSKYELSRDDVLVAMDRTWVSAGIKFAIVDDDALPSLLVQRVARLRAKSSILPRYIGYWIGSRFSKPMCSGYRRVSVCRM
ncbi:restriction endonuclease subunit S [Roseitranquillus sediminis]|uniref:restriction endonuclease subunit S n=1 Tax=Roseitranquillus sediminis TaxID=2809051 RepID=UPI001D0C42E7|nr:restriction endonuclease subunit S [Roseitranquillus sediminis]MBM9593440.1 restriction endonuclease subunit S [Roseitranquillus sediminis]